jgi:tripeptidyl-peptidase-1
MVMYGIIYPQTVTLYEVAETIEGVNTETYAGFPLAIEELLDAIDGSFCSKKDKAAGLDCGKYDPTRVISISYGSAEIFSPQAYLKRQCNEFAKLGLQGVTFTISSGDWGVAAQPGYQPSKNLYVTAPVRSDCLRFN